MNPSAGGGLPQQRRVMEKLKEQWLRQQLYGVKEYGGEYLSQGALKAPPGELAYRPRLEAALQSILAEKPDMILSIGGDGTAAYIAEILIQLGSQVPLAGLGSGTANVGPIVSLNLAGKLPPPEELEEAELGAIKALDHTGSHIAYGFNDLVLANTFLGSREGRWRTFEARALAEEGRLQEAAPLKAAFRKEQRWILNGEPIPPPPFMTAQLIASPVEQDNYYGRAVTGLLCCTPQSPHQGALYASPIPLVTMESFSEGYSGFLTGSQLLLKEGDRLRLEGLAPEICAVADGNPHLVPEGIVTLQYVPKCLRVLRRRQAYE